MNLDKHNQTHIYICRWEGGEEGLMCGIKIGNKSDDERLVCKSMDSSWH